MQRRQQTPWILLPMILAMLLGGCTSPAQHAVRPEQQPRTSWRPPSDRAPRQFWTTATLLAYATPTLSSRIVGMIPPATALQVVLVGDAWYQVAWVDRGGVNQVRWIEATPAVTTTPPTARTPAVSPATARPQGSTHISPANVSRPQASVEEIRLAKVGGVYHLPVEINGVLTLHFILDSGASEVHIPADVVWTLVRAGTIKETDFLPGKTYVLADGSELRSPRFTLRSLKIGTRHITNIPASVGNLSSSLLLGQSFLEKLGTWGIDNQRQVLMIHTSASQPFTASPSLQPQMAALPSSTGSSVAEQLYRRALQDYQERYYQAAVINLKQFLKLAPNSPQAGTAQFLIGEALYGQRQHEAAIVAFDEVAQRYRYDPQMPAALLKMGYAFAELQDYRNARFLLRRVQQKFPNSAEAQQAAEKLKALR